MSIRRRRPEDVPQLERVLAAQQPSSGYPVRWPLPFPIEQFLVRSTERAAWVAVEGVAGEDPHERPETVIGHVSVLDAAPGWEADAWSAGTGLAASALGVVGVLFVDPTATGRGVGSALLSTAVEHLRSIGRVPVLDVVSESPRAVALYERHGWHDIGSVRPPWLPADRAPVRLMALGDGGANVMP